MVLILSDVERLRVVFRRGDKVLAFDGVRDISIDKAVEPVVMQTPAVEEDYQILSKTASGSVMNVNVSAITVHESFSDLRQWFYNMFGTMSDAGDYTENQGDGIFSTLPGSPVIMELQDCSGSSCSLVLRKSGYITSVEWTVSWGRKYIVDWSIQFLVGVTV